MSGGDFFLFGLQMMMMMMLTCVSSCDLMLFVHNRNTHTHIDVCYSVTTHLPASVQPPALVSRTLMTPLRR